MAAPRSRIGESYLQVIPVIGNLTQQLTAQITAAISSSTVNNAATAAGNNVGQQLGTATGNTAGAAAASGMGTQILGGLAALGIASLLKDQIAAGFEMQGNDNKVQAALNLTKKQAEETSQATKNLVSGAYGETYEDASSYIMAIAGSWKDGRNLSADELTKMGKDVANLSSTYDLDSNMIAQTVQSIIGSGLADDWDGAVSLILSGYQTMGASGEDWIESLNEFSGAFKGLGLEGSRGVNLINSAINAGAKDSDAFADSILEIGIKIGDFSADEGLVGLGLDPNAVRENMKQGGDVAYEQYMEILNKLQASGSRDLFAQVIGTKSEDYYNAFQTMDLSGINDPLSEGTGDLEKFDKELNKGAISSLTAFKNTVQMAFTETLQPALEWITPKLAEFVGFLQANEGAATALAVIAGGLLLGSIVLLTAALWAMVAPVLANPLTWIILGAVAAIALIVLAVVTLVQNWDKGTKAMGEIWAGFTGWISGVWGGFIGWITDTWTGFNVWVIQGLQGIGNWIIGLGISIANFFIDMTNAPLEAINFLIRALNSIQFELPDWMGGGKFEGFGIAEIETIPRLAKGATVLPSNGGTLVNVAEAHKPETIVDTGGVNKLISLTNSKLDKNGAGRTVQITVNPPAGMDVHLLAKALREEEEMAALRG